LRANREEEGQTKMRRGKQRGGGERKQFKGKQRGGGEERGNSSRAKNREEEERGGTYLKSWIIAGLSLRGAHPLAVPELCLGTLSP
jgi:hypothetical protein